MEEIKERLRAFIQEKFEIDDDPDFTDDVHLFKIRLIQNITTEFTVQATLFMKMKKAI